MFERLPESPVGHVYVSPSGRTAVHEADCFTWLAEQADNSFHAVVTDPPYGVLEYTPTQIAKLRAGKGGVWRIPPSIGGHRRSPVPRFTVITGDQRADIQAFFTTWAKLLLPKLVPGAHVIVAANPLLGYVVAYSLVSAGFEMRGELVRLTQTLRGGDRPKNAEGEFPQVTVMARSKWEPWVIVRKPTEGSVAENLRMWGTGGLRREGAAPFPDVLPSSPTRGTERGISPHPSLKPQAFMRRIVRAALPLGHGVVLDPFVGGGATLAACEALGYEGVGVEIDPTYARMAAEAIPLLARLPVPEWLV